MVGGAADLSESTKTEFPGGDDERYTRERAGRNVFFGVREHGMGGVGQRHGRPRRHRAPVRLDVPAVRRLHARLDPAVGADRPAVAWVFTHDSVALGEDGPTHQPVEHLAALRAIPGLTVLRPGDAAETAAAWRVILEDLDGPAVLALSRQDLPVQEGVDWDGVARGAYVLREADDAQAVIVGTGGELTTAVAAADLLAADGVAARVVSMPSWELFAAQDEAYREEVLPAGLPTVVGRGRHLDGLGALGRPLGVDRPLRRLGAGRRRSLEKLGITPTGDGRRGPRAARRGADRLAEQLRRVGRRP